MRAGLDRHRAARRDMARDRMRAACRVGHRDLERQAEGGDAAVEILEQRALAPEERRAAGDIEPDPVRADRARPSANSGRPAHERETAQPFEIGLGLRIDDLEFGRERRAPS